MRNTGIVRNLDNLGRIVNPIEILIQDETIILRKYEPVDIFNGDKEDLIDYCGKKVSKNTIKEMAQLAGLID